MQSVMRALEQERANHAWKCIDEVRNQSFASDYRSLAVKTPSLILTNGLGQTLAFLQAKGKDEHNMLYKHISDWLKQQLKLNDDLLEWIVEKATSQQYRLATMEALALLQCLKRFAEAVLPKGREE